MKDRVAGTHKAPIVATYIPSEESNLTFWSPPPSFLCSRLKALALVKGTALSQVTDALLRCPKLHLKAWKRSVLPEGLRSRRSSLLFPPPLFF